MKNLKESTSTHMPKHTDGIEIYYAKDAAAWRNWLQKNHATKKAVWLLYYKPNSGKPRVNYADAVEEALCFGWIDSTANKLDEFRSIQYFAPRKPKSNWSRINKQRVEKLVKEEKMQAAGMEAINKAKANGSWDALNEVEDLVIPGDLQKLLAKNRKARKYFMAFPNSSKKIILYWIMSAKTDATRKKRLEESVRLAALNVRANHYQPKTPK